MISWRLLKVGGHDEVHVTVASSQNLRLLRGLSTELQLPTGPDGSDVATAMTEAVATKL